MKGAKSPNGASYEAEERGEQREAPVHRLKDVIKEQRHNDIARSRDEVGCETQPAANEEGDCSRYYVEQIKDTGNPGLAARRRVRNPFHHFTRPSAARRTEPRRVIPD
jgi:hypothetical protein